MNKDNIDELFPTTDAAQADDPFAEIDALRREIMAGGHADSADIVPDTDKGDLPTQYRDIEALLIKAISYEQQMHDIVENAKEQLLQKMIEGDIKQWRSERMLITHVFPTTTKKFDSTAFKDADPETYEKYMKVSTTKDSIRIKVLQPKKQITNDKD